MCIRHHTNCSVESVVERGSVVLPLSSVRGLQRSSSCRNFNTHVSAQGIEDRGTTFAMVLKHEVEKPPLLNI